MVSAISGLATLAFAGRSLGLVTFGMLILIVSYAKAASGLSIAEAEAIADEEPDLIWLDVPEDEYYGEPTNMEPER